MRHDALDLAPLAVDVVGRQDQQRLAAFDDTAFHLLDAWRASCEIAEVDESVKTGFLDSLQQLTAHPLLVLAAVGDEDVVILCGHGRMDVSVPE